jgi:putative chitinase
MDHANRVAWTLGNSEPGDGEKFLGRGLLQTTGRANYDHAGTALNLDLLNHPELLEQPEHGCRSSALFWKRHGLNELADDMRFDEITKTINGGLTGAAERRGYYEAALAAVGESVEVA